MLDKLFLFGRALSKTAKDKESPESPHRVDLQHRPSTGPISKASSARSSECGEAKPMYRWESWDYSDPVYEIDRHPICKSNSRKLSDLGALKPIEVVGSPRHSDAAATAVILESQPLSVQEDLTVGPPVSLSNPQTAIHVVSQEIV